VRLRRPLFATVHHHCITALKVRGWDIIKVDIITWMPLRRELLLTCFTLLCSLCSPIKCDAVDMDKPPSDAGLQVSEVYFHVLRAYVPPITPHTPRLHPEASPAPRTV
jgi:hypothetical protein